MKQSCFESKTYICLHVTTNSQVSIYVRMQKNALKKKTHVEKTYFSYYYTIIKLI